MNVALVVARTLNGLALVEANPEAGSRTRHWTAGWLNPGTQTWNSLVAGTVAIAFVVAHWLVEYSSATSVPAKLVLATHSSRPVWIKLPPSLNAMAYVQALVRLRLASAVPP